LFRLLLLPLPLLLLLRTQKLLTTRTSLKTM